VHVFKELQYRHEPCFGMSGGSEGHKIGSCEDCRSKGVHSVRSFLRVFGVVSLASIPTTGPTTVQFVRLTYQFRLALELRPSPQFKTQASSGGTKKRQGILQDNLVLQVPPGNSNWRKHKHNFVRKACRKKCLCLSHLDFPDGAILYTLLVT